jgi:PAS domain S-box-containing protein
VGDPRHKPAFAALPVAAFVADAEGVIVDVSEAWGDQLGLPAEASVGHPIWACLGGPLGRRVEALWAACLDGTRLDLEDLAEPGEDGWDRTDRYWQVEAHRGPDATIVGVIHDVTDRWQRAQMQRRLLAWSRRLQQASTFGELVDLAEAEAKEVTRYRSFWLFIRPTPESPVARRLASSGRASAAQWEHLPEIVIADDVLAAEVLASQHTVIVEDARTDPRTNKDTVARLGSRTSINVPLTFLDQNIGAFGMGSFGEEGVRLPTPLELEVVETMASHIAVAAGRLRFLAERRQAEHERQALELRMLRLQNLESLGVLAGGIAHDVNNLMTVVIGNVALGRTAVQGDPDADDALQHAHLAAMRTTALAEQMLAYAGHGALRREAGDLHGIASESLALARVSVPKRTVVELRGREGCVVTGDLTQLRQLVMNLISNAGEAIGEENEGAITLTVDRHQLDARVLAESLLEPAEPGPYVVLEITRRRLRHGCPNAGPHVRPVLHHQGHRARPGHVCRPGHRTRTRRRPVGRLDRWQGHDVPRGASRR